ncbi:MAG TPA: tripartite tricarboxylate transporter substrate binding protein [Xanthobacteraceae bacterium]|nr:tripartite tricarboxylate transporter substrate binding protein [Xanthobacteraceae bacterium]
MNPPRIGAALLALLLAAPIMARAQDWPSRPIRMIVPFPAGGSTDVAARPIAAYLSRALNQQVFVENKSGASGTVGMEIGAKSAPDGYTILITSDQVATGPYLFPLTFDPLKSLAPVVQLSRQPVVLAVHPSLGVNDVAGLVALAKQRPGMSYATSGVGSQQHIVAAWFAQIAGIDLVHVPYRGGGQAITDLIAGHVKIASLGSTPLIPQYRAGAVRLLAQSTTARSPSLPDVPTYQEAGIEGLVIEQWLGVFVPAGTPASIVARLNAEINKALADPAIRASYLNAAQEPVGGSADQLAHLLHADFEKYGRLVKQLGIKMN